MIRHHRGLSSGIAPRRAARTIALLFAPLVVAAAIGCKGAEGPAGPAGPSGDLQLLIAVGTGSLILDESALDYSQIPGLTTNVTIAPGGSSALLMETDGGVQVNSADPSALCLTDVAIFVDGTQVGPGRRTIVANTPNVLYAVGSYGFSVTTGVAEGTHSISVMAKAFTPLAGVQCYVGSAFRGSGLPGRPHLQGVLNVVVLP
jgi:hypothetical protein